MTRSKGPRRKFRVSLKGKLLFAMMAVILAVIATIWVLQVVFLPNFYIRAKREKLLDIARQVSASIDEKGILASPELFGRLAGENLVCVDVSGVDYRDILFAEGLGDSCYIHSNALNRLRVLRDAAANAGQYRLTVNMPHPQLDVKYMTCAIASVTQTEDQTPCIVIVTASLAPLQDVTEVIKQMLLYITPFLIVAALAVTFWVSRSMTKPLVKISGAARKIADGSLNARVDIRSNDEFGDLARDFNTMSRELAKVNTLQKELVANISHDIRTPLTMIKGYAEMIKDITGEDKEAREQQLDIIIDETNRLSTLVSDVMDLSLMQAGQTAFHPAVFDITGKARDILGRYQLLEQTRGFAFQLEADRPWLVYADEVRIEQVLYNLINNAVNHIGEIKRITVRILEEDGEARIEVNDTGTGISQEDLPLIWDRYYKPYKKGEKQVMGTGLGLSIVKAVLVNHHSRFGVNSTLGVGSTFWFTLALAETEETRSALPPVKPEG